MALPVEGIVLQRHELAAWGQAMRDSGRKIAFTNGCFDLIHGGHLASLDQAASTADALVVALNDDASVRQLKGAGRPVLAAEERAALIASLRQVSAVTIFAEPTPLAVINELKPDVLVKGDEYAEADIVGATEVATWGGKVVRVPMVPGKSTTEIIAAIKALP
jgi:rfaE bifunctional protein nucleotidyltransferase chain/domain